MIKKWPDQDAWTDYIQSLYEQKRNTYDFANLVSKNNLLHYYADGKQISYLGIDLSKYQIRTDLAIDELEKEELKGVNKNIKKIKDINVTEVLLEKTQYFGFHNVDGTNARY